MWSRILATMYSYEYIENSILTIDNRIDWFFRPEMLEKIYDEETLHWRMSKSIYSSLPCYVQSDFTKSINSDQFLETLVQKAFATVLVRECYSYEIDVENPSCLLFKTAASWLETWNETARVQQRHYFELISLLQLVMSDFLRQCLMILSAKLVVKDSLLLLFIGISIIECEIDRRWSIDSIVVSSWSALARSTFSRSKRRRYSVSWLIFCQSYRT